MQNTPITEQMYFLADLQMGFDPYFQNLINEQDQQY
jgi:hypothetical protein